MSNTWLVSRSVNVVLLSVLKPRPRFDFVSRHGSRLFFHSVKYLVYIQVHAG